MKEDIMNLEMNRTAIMPNRIYQSLQMLETSFLKFNHENELNKLRILNCEFDVCRNSCRWFFKESRKMNQKQFAYINAIYDIEDNLEEVKNYFRSHGYFNEYKMATEIQTVFRSGIAARVDALEKRVLN